MRRLTLAASLILALHTARALPTLQLDIGGGTYVGGSDETVYANNTSFTLYALHNGPASGPFYISAALVPRQEQTTPPPNVGSFTIGASTYDANNMNYGLPPLEVIDGLPGVQDLGPHGIFPTYYAEIEFTFGSTQTTPYNSADDPGGPSGSGTGMFVQAFTVNVGNLLGAYSIHFDLYNTKIKGRTGNYTVDDFAPFSHDAQSTPGGGGNPPPVPEAASTVTLLGLALLGLVTLRKRLARA